MDAIDINCSQHIQNACPLMSWQQHILSFCPCISFNFLNTHYQHLPFLSYSVFPVKYDVPSVNALLFDYIQRAFYFRLCRFVGNGFNASAWTASRQCSFESTYL